MSPFLSLPAAADVDDDFDDEELSSAEEATVAGIESRRIGRGVPPPNFSNLLRNSFGFFTSPVVVYKI